MKKIKGMIVAVLLFTGASAQVPGSHTEEDKTARMSFRTVYETNAYYNEVEENIELKYANLKVPIFEKMEGPQDSIWLIEEQVATLRELIKMEEYNFIQWEKNADRTAPDFRKEREDKLQFASAEIAKMRAAISGLENQKPAYVRDLKSQEVILKEIDREKEKELDQARQQRQAALAKRYRA